MAQVTFKVVGTTFGGRDAVLADINPQEGHQGLLVPDYDNPVDPNAVQVLLVNREGEYVHVGHLEATQANLFEPGPFGAPLFVSEPHLHPETGKVAGFRFKVERSDLVMRPVEERVTANA